MRCSICFSLKISAFRFFIWEKQTVVGLCIWIRKEVLIFEKLNRRENKTLYWMNIKVVRNRCNKQTISSVLHNGQHVMIKSKILFYCNWKGCVRGTVNRYGPRVIIMQYWGGTYLYGQRTWCIRVNLCYLRCTLCEMVINFWILPESTYSAMA